MSTPRATILQIVPELDTGGAELSTAEIAEAVVRAGGRAIVVSEGGRLADRIARAGGEIVLMPVASKAPWQMMANARALARLVEGEGVSLIHARSRAPAWSAWAAARRTGRPFVTTYHGAYNERGRLKRLYNSIMARGDRVIANSRYTAELIHARYGTPPERLRIVPRGVDLARFAPTPEVRARGAALRAAWQIPDGAPIILQAARLTPWKGQRVVIEAVARLKRDGRLGDAVLVFAGDAQGRDDYRASLMADLARLGLGAQVRLPGHVADIAAAFAVAHVSVVASTEPEAFGRAAAEALAMGTPVVVSDLGSPPETVLAPPRVPASDATGWIVPPGDAEALAAALGAALAMPPAARSAMAARARSSIATRFTLAAMQRGTLATYDELLGTRLADSLPPSEPGKEDAR